MAKEEKVKRVEDAGREKELTRREALKKAQQETEKKTQPGVWSA